MRVAIAGYNNFQRNLLGKAVSEPESLPGSQEGGRRPYQEFYHAGSHQRCDFPSPSPSTFYPVVEGCGLGAKEGYFPLSAASGPTVALSFATLVCGDGELSMFP